MTKRLTSFFHSLHTERQRVEACCHVIYYSAAVLDFEHIHHYAEIGVLLLTIMAIARRDTVTQ